MKGWIAILGAIALATAGCGNDLALDPIVVLPPSRPGAPNALAMKGSQIAEAFAGGLANGPPWNDPEALVILVSDAPQDCASAKVSTDAIPPSRWQSAYVIPQALDTTGPIDLQDCRIGRYDMSINCYDDGLCGRGLGQGQCESGTLDVTSSDATSVSFALQGAGIFGTVNADGSETSPVDGSYVAKRCGEVPAPPVPSPALALRGSKLPPGSALPVPPDPNALVVVVGDPGATCATPIGDLDCTGRSRLVFVLPPSLQVTGTVQLSDPVAGAAGSPSCAATTGGFASGSVEIRSIDAIGITFRVFGSYTAIHDPGELEVDGLYAATTCP